MTTPTTPSLSFERLVISIGQEQAEQAEDPAGHEAKRLTAAGLRNRQRPDLFSDDSEDTLLIPSDQYGETV